MKVRTPLIIGAGTGWSATSPLYMTLQCSNKCAHVGLKKEDHLLYHVYSNDAWEWRKPDYENLIRDSMSPVWKYEWGRQSKYAFHQNLKEIHEIFTNCLLYTSPSPRD